MQEEKTIEPEPKIVTECDRYEDPRRYFKKKGKKYVYNESKEERVLKPIQVDRLKMKDYLAYSHGTCAIWCSALIILVTVAYEIHNIDFFVKKLKDDGSIGWYVFIGFLMLFAGGSFIG